MKNIEKFSGNSSREWTSRQTEDRKSTRTRQKNKRGDSKVESNDSAEIPNRGEAPEIPGLPSGRGGLTPSQPRRSFRGKYESETGGKRKKNGSPKSVEWR